MDSFIVFHPIDMFAFYLLVDPCSLNHLLITWAVTRAHVLRSQPGNITMTRCVDMSLNIEKHLKQSKSIFGVFVGVPALNMSQVIGEFQLLVPVIYRQRGKNFCLDFSTTHMSYRLMLVHTIHKQANINLRVQWNLSP